MKGGIIGGVGGLIQAKGAIIAAGGSALQDLGKKIAGDGKGGNNGGKYMQQRTLYMFTYSSVKILKAILPIGDQL